MPYQEVGKKTTDALVKHKDFYETNRDAAEPTPYPAWIARWKGDSIEGILVSGPHTNYRRNSSYRLQVMPHDVRADEGDIWMIFGNKQLHRIIRDNKLIGKKIRIELLGRQRQDWGGRPRKVYRVWIDQGKLIRKETEVY